MADSEGAQNRRLTLTSEMEGMPRPANMPVVASDGESIGTARSYLKDTQANEARYLVIDCSEDFTKSPSSGNQLVLPVGILEKKQGQIAVKDRDTDELRDLPRHQGDKLLSYEEELRIRARLEKPAQVDAKTGKENARPDASPGDRTGEAINRKLTSKEEAYKRDKKQNEGKLSDAMQGRYTPNLSGDLEGIKKAATNAEGKHDIPSTSGHAGSTSKGSVAAESSGTQIPEEHEMPTTDKPGATLGQAEVENRYRDAENQSLPPGQGNPDLPLNAPDDFYRHPLFDTSQLR